MNIFKKVVVLSVTICCVVLFSSSVMAENMIDTSLYAREDLPLYLRCAEIDLKTKHVYHKADNMDMPAYCLNEQLPGITKDNTYSVNVNNEIADNDIGLWRIIINGYPYKSIEELGCENESQAYTATQHAIYYYLVNKNGTKRSLSQYSDTGGKGVATLKAMKKIIGDAENSSAVKPSKEIEIIKENEEWQKDEREDEYVYKTFSVSSKTEMKSYKIVLENLEEDLLSKIKIVDKNNETKENFEPSEEFKIMVPEEIEETISFDVNIIADLKTMPIYFGKPSDSQVQSYALTTMYEKVEKEIEEIYEAKAKPIETKIETVSTQNKTQTEKKLPKTGM